MSIFLEIFNKAEVKIKKDSFIPRDDGYYYITDIFENDDELLTEVSNYIKTYLITKNGSVNYGAIEVLDQVGISIRAGDKDTFGWLTGILEKGNIRHVFS